MFETRGQVTSLKRRHQTCPRLVRTAVMTSSQDCCAVQKRSLSHSTSKNIPFYKNVFKSCNNFLKHFLRGQYKSSPFGAATWQVSLMESLVTPSMSPQCLWGFLPVRSGCCQWPLAVPSGPSLSIAPGCSGLPGLLSSCPGPLSLPNCFLSLAPQHRSFGVTLKHGPSRLHHGALPPGLSTASEPTRRAVQARPLHPAPLALSVRFYPVVPRTRVSTRMANPAHEERPEAAAGGTNQRETIKATWRGRRTAHRPRRGKAWGSEGGRGRACQGPGA